MPALGHGDQATPPSARGQNLTRTLGLLLLAGGTFATAQTMLNPALPRIWRTYSVPQSTAAWTLSAFFVTAAVAPSIAGRLGDMFGKRRLLVVELVLFSIGAVACALAPSIWLLIAGRVVMGTGAGIFSLSYAIVRDEFPTSRLATGIGLLASVIGVGVAVGFPLGGAMIDHFGVAAIFWVTASLAASTAVGVGFFIPESPVRSPGRVDFVGAVLLSVGLVAVLAAISQASVWGWLAAPTLALIGGGLLVLAAFARYELTNAQPLLNVRRLVARPLLANNCTTILIAYAGIGGFVLVPLLAQVPRSTGYGLGLSPGQSGLFLLPSALMTMVAAPVAGQLIPRLGGRPLVVTGALLGAAAFGLLAAMHSSIAHLALWPAIFGLGSGISYTALPVLVVQTVPQRMTGQAIGINTVLRNVGNALGTQVSTAILAATIATGTGLITDRGYTAALAVCALASLFGAAVAVFMPRWAR